jgi:chromosome segregation ATPase
VTLRNQLFDAEHKQKELESQHETELNLRKVAETASDSLRGQLRAAQDEKVQVSRDAELLKAARECLQKELHAAQAEKQKELEARQAALENLQGKLDAAQTKKQS